MTTSTKTDSFELHLPKEIRSLNKTLKDHWSVRRRHKEEWRALLISELRKAIIWDIPLTSKKYIIITRVMKPRQKEFDYDNLVGGNCKQLVDAMKMLIIWDDTAQYVEVKYLQKKGERGSTIIKVEFGRGRDGERL